ncbi:MAG: hypothetical protein HPY57_12950 [Ignavibacteria bacterium]|nr:hypothetical protein [Ignavibacteria bacterium]
MEFTYLNPNNIPKFREAALYFEEHGVYTKHLPGTSGYLNYWKEQVKRCLYGYRIGNDYITGYNYFYWNFSRIIIVKTVVDEFGIERTDRYESFPEPWDYDKYFFDYVEEAEKNGKHAVVLKARGVGYSFKGASMCNRNYFLIKNSKSFVVTSKSNYMFEDGILAKAWDMMDFIDTNTAWYKRRQFLNKIDHKRASYQKDIDGVKVEAGYKSEIMGIVTGQDVNKLRGKRGKLILIDEAGSFNDLLTAWNIIRPSVEQGNKTFGLILAMGTGGDAESNFMGLEELFFYPKGYNVFYINNIWSDPPIGECAFFVPKWANLEGFYDKNTGISDKENAINFIENKLLSEAKEAKDPNVLLKAKAENCIIPEDALTRIKNNFFPISYLKQRLAELTINKKYKDSESIGYLTYDDNSNIQWVENRSLSPIYDYPLSTNKVEGCIVIYEHPVKDDHGNVRPYIYIAGTDPYDDDESETTSLGSTLVMNILTGRIVAEYTGRPPTAKEYYENVLRLLKYYNAICNYEQNKKGMFAYFEQKNALYLLADTPKILKDRELLNTNGKGNKSKGTLATEAINKYARELIKSWLLETAYNKEHSNIHELVQIALIKELIYWAPGINADRISALGMLLILREDLIKYADQIKSISNKPYPGSDPIFNRILHRGKIVGRF